MKDINLRFQKFHRKILKYKALAICLSIALFCENCYSQNTIIKSPLAHQADSFFINEKYAEALKKYDLSFKAGNNNCDDYYTAARCAALLKNNIIAFKYLKISIKNGFVDENFVNEDYYFQSLHTQIAWKDLKPLFNSLKLKIESELVGLKNVPCYRLIPFCRNGLWGYLDAKDTSIVVKPFFQYTGFMTNRSVVEYKNKTSLYISNDGKIINTYTIENEDFDEIADNESGNFKFNLISSVDGYKGFKHQSGFVTEHSELYSKMEINTIKIKNKVYGIAYLNGYASIIDEEGNILNGFDFNDNYTYIMKCYNTKDSLVWFWFTDKANGTGFKNEKGETFFYNIFKKYPGFGSQTTWGFSYGQLKNGEYGVFDFEKIKWRVEPQQLEILGVNFNNMECKSNSPREPNKLFFLVKNKNGDLYYIDEELNEYRIN